MSRLCAKGKRVDSNKEITIIHYLGIDLDSYFEKYKPSEAELLDVFYQCVKAVANFNRGISSNSRKSYLHRDLKPNNFVIDTNGQVRLIDFGLSIASDGKTLVKTCDFVGTPDFIAPEIREKYHYSIKSEIYALGVMLKKFISSSKLMQENTTIVSLQKAMVLYNVDNRPDYQGILSTLIGPHQYSKKITKLIDNIDKALTSEQPAVEINKKNLLGWACHYGLVKQVRRCIKAGADVNQHDRHGYTPLIDAAGNNNTDVVRILIAEPTLDLLLTDYNEKTVFDYVPKDDMGEVYDTAIYQRINDGLKVWGPKKIKQAFLSDSPKAFIDEHALFAVALTYELVDEIKLCMALGCVVDTSKELPNSVNDPAFSLCESIKYHQYWLTAQLLAAKHYIPIRTKKDALDYACVEGRLEQALLLLAYGATVSSKAEQYFLVHKEETVAALTNLIEQRELSAQAVMPKEISYAITTIFATFKTSLLKGTVRTYFSRRKLRKQLAEQKTTLMSRLDELCAQTTEVNSPRLMASALRPRAPAARTELPLIDEEPRPEEKHSKGTTLALNHRDLERLASPGELASLLYATNCNITLGDSPFEQALKSQFNNKALVPASQAVASFFSKTTAPKEHVETVSDIIGSYVQSAASA